VARAFETLRKLNWEVMEHPAHSPDLAPSDFHLFGLLKEALGGRRFRRDEDRKNVVQQWLRVQPKTFYYDGIKLLVGRREKCVEKQGDYVEKCFCNLSSIYIYKIESMDVQFVYVCVSLGSVGIFFGVRVRYYAAAQQ
jgi:hypothetical protein